MGEASADFRWGRALGSSVKGVPRNGEPPAMPGSNGHQPGGGPNSLNRGYRHQRAENHHGWRPSRQPGVEIGAGWVPPTVTAQPSKSSGPRYQSNGRLPPRGAAADILPRARDQTHTDALESGSLPPEEIAEFIARWQLDEASHHLLAAAPAAVQRSVMSRFSPRSGTRDVTLKFVSFIKSVAAPRRSHPIGAAPPGQVHRDCLDDGPPPAPPGLDSTPGPVPMVVTSSPPVPLPPPASSRPRATVVAPGEHTDPVEKNVLQWGLNERTSPVPPPPPVEEEGPVPWSVLVRFGERWGVDLQSLEELSQLPPDVCAQVVTNFNPPSGTRDMNARLRAFIRTQNVRGQRQLPLGSGSETVDEDTTVPAAVRRPDRAAAAPASQGNVSPAPAEKDAVCQGGNVAGKSWPEQANLYELRSFVETWGIDAEGTQALCELSEDMRCKVYAEFQPDADTKDVSAKLRSFIRVRILARAGRRRRRSVQQQSRPSANAIGGRKAVLPLGKSGLVSAGSGWSPKLCVGQG